ncbi:MAG TPA: hypothetical protein VGR26_14580 [Acidimicrobiales bacterium]|nr:hypothetical protein [Acidimicrobiales bacterium]
MPWCDDCRRFWTTDAVSGDGTCPSCGAALPEPRAGGDVGAPWHFKLLLVAVVAYLGWRAVELIVWLVGRF